MEAKGATPVGCLTIGKCFRIVGCCWLRSMFRNISKTFDGLLVLMTGQLCMPIENQVCPQGGRNEKRTQLYKESTLLASRSHSSYTLLSRYMLYWATKVFCTICETMYRRNLKTHVSKYWQHLAKFRFGVIFRPFGQIGVWFLKKVALSFQILARFNIQLNYF